MKRIPVALALAATLCVMGTGGPDRGRADDIAKGPVWPTHLPYPPASWERMVRVNGQYLKPTAARAFLAMAEEARRDGVHIVLRSGYRSSGYQSRLFFGGAESLGISLTERARISAPPGYSEHHTGYAVDLDDARDPRYLRRSFEETAASAWLMANARRFCFELSFPPGNPQGIEYEPWHWRFVGSMSALRVFAPARVHFPGRPASRIAGAVPGGGGILTCHGTDGEDAATETALGTAADTATATATAARLPGSGQRPDRGPEHGSEHGPAAPPPVTPAALVGR